MAKSPQISTEVAKAFLDTIASKVSPGSPVGDAVVEIWSGTRPNNFAGTPAGTLLAELILASPYFGAATLSGLNAQVTAAAIANDTSANATGTATWFRLKNRSTNADNQIKYSISGTVGTSNADMILDTVSLVAGQIVSISSWVITMPTGQAA